MSLLLLSASAGSGKTHRLSREFVRLCLQSENPSYAGSLISMTFTNKATQEMKERILKLLMELAQSKLVPDENDALFPTFKALGQQEVARRADAVLHYLLKNYHFFSVSTIDSFFQGIIRQFQRELSLDFPVEVELDTDAVLEASIKHLFDRLDANPDLLQWFNQWVRDKLNDGGDWDVRKDLRNLGKELFREGVSDHWDETISLEELRAVQKELRVHNLEVDRRFEANQKAVAQLLEKADLSPSDFSGKANSFVAMWLRWSLLELSEKPSFFKAQNRESWFTKSQDKSILAKADAIADQLQLLLDEVYQWITHDLSLYKTYKAVLRHFSTYVALRFLYDALKTYCSDQDKLLLSEANKMVSQVIKQSDLSLLYEKTGQRYNHMLVDEFQDTSASQWTNLKPLFEQTLAEGKFDLIVGDIKQAIYRWRNGNWEIMHQKVEEELGTVAEIRREALQYNYRSAPVVIDFNNALFEKAVQWVVTQYSPEMLPEAKTLLEQLPIIYQDVRQTTPDKNKNLAGLVGVSILNVDDQDDSADEADDAADNPNDRILYQWLSQNIREALARGFVPNDIGVLVRNGKQESKVLQWIHRMDQSSEFSIPLQAVSEKGLRLAGNAVVELLAHLLAYRTSPEDKSHLPQVVYFYDLLSYDSATHVPNFNEALPIAIEKSLSLPMASLSHWFVQVLQLLDLSEKSPLYVAMFLDHVRAFELKSGADPAGFLAWWETNKLKLGVSVDENENALNVMTIHKSKGLQFPVVLIPFTDEKLIDFKNHSLIYVQHSDDPKLQNLGVFPVFASKNELKGTPFEINFQRETVMQLVDSLNLLYVATTRAERLLQIALVKKEKKNPSKTFKLSDLILNCLEKEFDVESGNLEQGDKELKKESRTSVHREVNALNIDGLKFRFNPIKAGSWTDKELPLLGSFDESTGAMHTGTLVHEVLGRMLSIDQLELVLNQMEAEGLLKDAIQKTEIKEKLTQFLGLAEVAAWFSKEVKVYAEREIIEVNGKSYRPDRVVIGTKGAEVIDFKTGKPSGRYAKQIRQYAHLLQKMGLPSVSASIAYIDSLHIDNIEIAQEQ
jgi:ATP-dependent helicase/nuclease subunit A